MIVPGLSWLDGTGALAWTMYSSSASYRVRIAVFDASDRQSWFAPGGVAARSGRELGTVLAGADSFRHGPQGVTLRGRLGAIAAHACEASGGVRVIVYLDERRNLDAPVETRRAERRCSGGSAGAGTPKP